MPHPCPRYSCGEPCHRTACGPLRREVSLVHTARGRGSVQRRRHRVALTSSMAYSGPSALRSLPRSGPMHWRRDLVSPREANMHASKHVLRGRSLSITDHVRWSPHQVEKGDNADRRLVSDNVCLLGQRFTRPKVLHAECNWRRRDSDRVASETL
jgi:hypothetical protein